MGLSFAACAVLRTNYMWTLHAYILRDLLKTFLLALLAMTVIVTMGGGLINVIKFEGVTSRDVLSVMPLMIPAVVTIFMPIAALFAASMTYGRLAADNELQACRAAGINIHRLLLPLVFLALGVAAFTLIAGSFIIPECTRQIDRVSKANARDWVSSQLTRRGYVRIREKYFISAASVRNPEEEELRKANHPVGNFSYLYVVAPTVLELDKNGQVSQFATARAGLVQFDTRKSPIQASLFAEDVRLSRPQQHAVEFAQQKIGPLEVPLAFPERPAFADLGTLLRWRAEPWNYSEIGKKVSDYIVILALYAQHADLAARLAAGEKVVVSDDDVHYTITAKTAVPDRKDVAVGGVRIEHRVRGVLKTVYEAPEAKVTARPQPTDAGRTQLLIDIRLIPSGDRAITESTPGAGGRVSKHDKALNIPPVIIAMPNAIAALTPRQILDSSFTIENLPNELELDRRSVHRSAAEFIRKVVAETHLRLIFALSSLVTLIMAAALGIMFRGARALAAFALAMAPFAFVMLIMFMGKQFTTQERLFAIGPYVMWSGLAFCLLADLIVLRIGVRR